MQLPSLKAYVVKHFQAFSCKVKNAIGTSNMYIYIYIYIDEHHFYAYIKKEERKINF